MPDSEISGSEQKKECWIMTIKIKIEAIFKNFRPLAEEAIDKI